MNTYLVTATFKNVALMGAAYDLFLKVIEDKTLNDELLVESLALTCL